MPAISTHYSRLIPTFPITQGLLPLPRSKRSPEPSQSPPSIRTLVSLGYILNSNKTASLLTLVHRPDSHCRLRCRPLPIEVAMMTASLRANSGLRLASSVYTARPATAAAAVGSPLGKLAIPASLASISSSSSFSLSSSSSSRSYTSSSRSSRLHPLLSSSFSSSLSRRSGVPSLNPTQVRTMAFDGNKIKVKNPVVELDGDEVWSFFFFFPLSSLLRTPRTPLEDCPEEPGILLLLYIYVGLRSVPLLGCGHLQEFAYAARFRAVDLDLAIFLLYDNESKFH